MARPSAVDIVSGLEGWDGEINDNFELVLDAPFPVFEYNGTLTAFSSAYAANEYDRCLAMVNDTTVGWILVFSNGTVWKRIPKQATDPSDLGGSAGGTGTAAVSITDPVAAPATATILRDDLVNNALPEIRNNLNALQAKINAILAAQRLVAQM